MASKVPFVCKVSDYSNTNKVFCKIGTGGKVRG